MKNLFATIAVLFFIGWGVAFFGFHAGPYIHFLPVFMLIAIAIRSAQGKGSKKSLSIKNY